MASASTSDAGRQAYPPLPRALPAPAARRSGGVAPGRGGPRALPRSGPLMRALLSPSAGDATGSTLGDPVRPFLRFQRRRFPTVARSLAALRARMARGDRSTTGVGSPAAERPSPAAGGAPAGAAARTTAVPAAAPVLGMSGAAPTGAAMRHVAPPLAFDAAAGFDVARSGVSSAPSTRPPSMQRPVTTTPVTTPPVTTTAGRSSAPPAASSTVTRSATAQRTQTPSAGRPDVPPAARPATGEAAGQGRAPATTIRSANSAGRRAIVTTSTPAGSVLAGSTPAGTTPVESQGVTSGGRSDTRAAIRGTATASSTTAQARASQGGRAQPVARAATGRGPVQRRSRVEEQTPAQRAGGAARASGESVSSERVSTSDVAVPAPRAVDRAVDIASSETLTSVVQGRTSGPEGGATIVAGGPSGAQSQSQAASMQPATAEAAGEGALDRLASMRGRLQRKTGSWTAPSIPSLRTPGLLPPLRRIGISGAASEALRAHAASIPDVVAPPPGIPMGRRGIAMDAMDHDSAQRRPASQQQPSVAARDAARLGASRSPIDRTSLQPGTVLGGSDGADGPAVHEASRHAVPTSSPPQQSTAPAPGVALTPSRGEVRRTPAPPPADRTEEATSAVPGAAGPALMEESTSDFAGTGGRPRGGDGRPGTRASSVSPMPSTTGALSQSSAVIPDAGRTVARQAEGVPGGGFRGMFVLRRLGPHERAGVPAPLLARTALEASAGPAGSVLGMVSPPAGASLERLGRAVAPEASSTASSSQGAVPASPSSGSDAPLARTRDDEAARPTSGALDTGHPRASGPARGGDAPTSAPSGLAGSDLGFVAPPSGLTVRRSSEPLPTSSMPPVPPPPRPTSSTEQRIERSSTRTEQAGLVQHSMPARTDPAARSSMGSVTRGEMSGRDGSADASSGALRAMSQTPEAAEAAHGEPAPPAPPSPAARRTPLEVPWSLARLVEDAEAQTVAESPARVARSVGRSLQPLGAGGAVLKSPSGVTSDVGEGSGGARRDDQSARGIDAGLPSDVDSPALARAVDDPEGSAARMPGSAADFAQRIADGAGHEVAPSPGQAFPLAPPAGLATSVGTGTGASQPLSPGPPQPPREHAPSPGDGAAAQPADRAQPNAADALRAIDAAATEPSRPATERPGSDLTPTHDAVVRATSSESASRASTSSVSGADVADLPGIGRSLALGQRDPGREVPALASRAGIDLGRLLAGTAGSLPVIPGVVVARSVEAASSSRTSAQPGSRPGGGTRESAPGSRASSAAGTGSDAARGAAAGSSTDRSVAEGEASQAGASSGSDRETTGRLDRSVSGSARAGEAQGEPPATQSSAQSPAQRGGASTASGGGLLMGHDPAPGDGGAVSGHPGQQSTGRSPVDLATRRLARMLAVQRAGEDSPPVPGGFAASAPVSGPMVLVRRPTLGSTATASSGAAPLDGGTPAVRRSAMLPLRSPAQRLLRRAAEVGGPGGTGSIARAGRGAAATGTRRTGIGRVSASMPSRTHDLSDLTPGVGLLPVRGATGGRQVLAWRQAAAPDARSLARDVKARVRGDMSEGMMSEGLDGRTGDARVAVDAQSSVHPFATRDRMPLTTSLTAPMAGVARVSSNSEARTQRFPSLGATQVVPPLPTSAEARAGRAPRRMVGGAPDASAGRIAPGVWRSAEGTTLMRPPVGLTARADSTTALTGGASGAAGGEAAWAAGPRLGGVPRVASMVGTPAVALRSLDRGLVQAAKTGAPGGMSADAGDVISASAGGVAAGAPVGGAFAAAAGVGRAEASSVASVRRNTVAGLPVSGAGALVGIAREVATDVARSTAEEATVTHAQRQVASVVERASDSNVQRAAASGAAEAEVIASAAGGVDAGQRERAERDQWMRLATSDEFELRLMEFLEDRLLGEIERRGGRYGGWFA